MGGLFGGGGQTQPSYYASNNPPQGAGSYIPTGQPQADASLQQLMSLLGNQSDALTSAVNYYQPGLQSGAVQQQQMGLGNAAYNTGAGDLGALQNLLSFYLTGIQGQGQAAQQGQLGLGQSLLGTGAGAANNLASMLQYYLPGAQAMGQTAQGQAQNLGEQLTGNAGQLLNQAFDPNQALYNQLANQTQQQVAASNAMSGLSGTPYGANLGNQAMTNLGINWNAQKQANEAAGLGAAIPAANAGVNLTQQSGLLPAQAVSSLYNSMLGGIGQAGQLGTAGAGLINQSGMTPFQDVLGAYSGALSPQGAATSLAGTGTSALNQSGLTGIQDLASLYGAAQPAQTQLENLLQSYLGLGQSASGLAGQLGAQGFNQNQTGLGNMLGAAGLGSNLLFGSGGLNGALGLGSSGLLGGLFGGGTAAAAAPGADVLGSLLGFGLF